MPMLKSINYAHPPLKVDTAAKYIYCIVLIDFLVSI